MSVSTLLEFFSEYYKRKMEQKNVDTGSFWCCSKIVKSSLPFQWFIDILPDGIIKEYSLNEKLMKEYVYLKKWDDIEKFVSIPRKYTPFFTNLKFEGYVFEFFCKANINKKYFIKFLPFNQKFNYFRLQEIFININLNLIKKFCPNFVETYYITTSEKKMMSTVPITVFTRHFTEIKRARSFVIIMEHLGRNIEKEIDDIIMNRPKELSSFLKYLIVQVFYGLYCSHKYFGFIHNDLTNFTNIKLLKFKNSQRRDLIFRFDKNHTIQLKDCPFLVKMIDFGTSYVEKPEVKDKTFEWQSDDIKKVVGKIFKKFKIPKFKHEYPNEYLNKYKDNDIGGFLAVLKKKVYKHLKDNQMKDFFSKVNEKKYWKIEKVLKCLKECEIFYEKPVSNLKPIPLNIDEDVFVCPKKPDNVNELWKELYLSELEKKCI